METNKAIDKPGRPEGVALKRDIHGHGEYAGRGCRSPRILVVDDDASIREMVLRALTSLGYDTVAVPGGSEAMDMFDRGVFDLVITDLQMPGMDGRTLSHRIKERFPGTPVILMTAHSKAHVLKDIENHCFDSALFKPFSLSDLQREVQGILNIGMQGKSH